MGMRVMLLGDNSLKVRGLLGGWGAQAAFGHFQVWGWKFSSALKKIGNIIPFACPI